MWIICNVLIFKYYIKKLYNRQMSKDVELCQLTTIYRYIYPLKRSILYPRRQQKGCSNE